MPGGFGLCGSFKDWEQCHSAAKTVFFLGKQETQSSPSERGGQELLALCRINMMQPRGCLAEAELDSSTQRSPGGQRAVTGALPWKAVSPQMARRKEDCFSPWLAGLKLEQPFTHSPWVCWNTLNAVGCLDLPRAVPLSPRVWRRERQVDLCLMSVAGRRPTHPKGGLGNPLVF